MRQDVLSNFGVSLQTIKLDTTHINSCKSIIGIKHMASAVVFFFPG